MSLILFIKDLCHQLVSLISISQKTTFIEIFSAKKDSSYHMKFQFNDLFGHHVLSVKINKRCLNVTSYQKLIKINVKNIENPKQKEVY